MFHIPNLLTIQLTLVHTFTFPCTQPIPRSRLNKDGTTHSGGSRKKEKLPKNTRGICKLMLKELEENEDSWPFLEPVEKKKFPEYYQVVKRPMDFQTMRSKVEEGK